MQEVPRAEAAPVAVGDLVEARGRRWRVLECEEGESARLLHLAATSGPPAQRALIDPIDRVARAGTSGRLRSLGRRAWMRALAGYAACAAPADLPASAARAAADLLTFQLEPLLAVTRGTAARLLIADEVGLGKTVQAALIARECLARAPSAAILIVVPAGLREQWRAELQDRAGLESTIVDAERLASTAAGLPPEVPPWRLLPLAIVSIDFVKQPDVLRGLRRARWDLAIFDEAHVLAQGTDRYAAADAIACRSLRTVLLSATPHDGDDDRFRALCDLGRLTAGEPLALFRRTRAGSLAGRRAAVRSRRLWVRLSPEEARLHDLLARYAARVWQAQPAGGPARLALTVIMKRAASSPWSAARSLRRRRQLLDAQPAAEEQAPLFDGTDLDGDLEPDAVLGVRALPRRQERAWLNVLVSAAARALRAERKIAVLSRFLRRVREPVIVFTEYRDTLSRLAQALASSQDALLLHGGLTTDARTAAIRAFQSGPARVLLATDAASQGLNLHQRCRIVLHAELPWNPLRLDQRAGRVDRLGQQRRVHAIELAGRGSIEERIASRLDARRRRIAGALGLVSAGTHGVEDPDLLGRALALDAFDTTGGEKGSPNGGRGGGTASPGPAGGAGADGRQRGTDIIHPALGEAAAAAADMLGRLRRLPGRPHHDGEQVPRYCRIRAPARRRLGLPAGVLMIYATRIVAGRAMESDLAALHAAVDLDRAPAAHERDATGAWLAAIRSALAPVVEARLDGRLHVLRASTLWSQPHLAARAREIARRDLLARRAEQLELFADRTRPSDFPVRALLPRPVDAPLRSAEPVLILVLE